MTGIVSDAVATRLHGRQASRTRALAAAGIVGVSVAAAVYRLLRTSEQETNHGE
jgi:hypothetical protein